MIEQLLWKLHCPGNICNAPVKFAINEIGAPAKEQTKRGGHHQIVALVGDRQATGLHRHHQRIEPGIGHHDVGAAAEHDHRHAA